MTRSSSPVGWGTPERLYWELTFVDPSGTQEADGDADPDGRHARSCLEYDWIQARAYRYDNGERTEVARLSPNMHKLVRYMADLSRRNGNVGVACTHQELIRAVWGEPEEWSRRGRYNERNLADLVNDLRKRIEQKHEDPRLLETVPGVGYRLITCSGKA